MDSANSNENYMRALTGYAYPTAEPVAGAQRRFIRRWILRVSRGPADGRTLDDAVRELERSARRATVEAYCEEANTPDNLPSVAGILVDCDHVVLEIVCPYPEAAVGDTAAIATWSVLRWADALWHIEDLEGIPKSYWFALHS